jgi:hypothetical protein
MSGAFKVRHRLRGEKAEVEERVKVLGEQLTEQIVATAVEGVVATAVAREEGARKEGMRLMKEMEREAREHRRIQEESSTQCIRLKGEIVQLKESLQQERAVFRGKAESEKEEADLLRLRTVDLQSRLEILRKELAEMEAELSKARETQVTKLH